MAGVLSTTWHTFPSTTSNFLARKISKTGAEYIKISPSLLRYKSFRFSDPNPGKDYQHIQKSSVPTYHFQKSLPRLPIPELDKTCERYLRAQQPLLTPEDFGKTKKYVEEFLKKDGIKCQNALIRLDRENKHTSYISKPWFDMYLRDRIPLPINYNPFLVFVNEHRPDFSPQLIRATNLVISSLRFYKSLYDGVLEPEVYHLNPSKSDTQTFRTVTGLLPKSLSWYGAYLFKAFPLDMSQYHNLFSTTRVPRLGKDSIKFTDDAKHILVMRRGHFYVFDVLDENGDILGPDVILSSIQHIIGANDPVAEHPVGLLTTEDRNEWAIARKHLSDMGNAELFQLIDSSLLNLVLDDESPGTDPVRLVRLFLHGDGVNRWFDKSFSLIVTGDGTAGLNFEHSWGDGVAVLRYFNDVHVDSTTKPKVRIDTLRSRTTNVRKLEFQVDDRMKNTIARARKRYEKHYNSLEVRVMDYQRFGRDLCKPLGISPDAMMQLSFQMAYEQMTNKQVATYESCSTAAFKHGRTETVRPCTIEAQKFCKATTAANPPFKREFQEILKECSKAHSNLIKEAAMGQGFDRHLFALKLRAKCEELDPAIFNDSAYTAINHNILSTSTLSSDHLQLGAFGPVVQDGYGIGYSIWKNRLGSIITNYEGQSDGAGFYDALKYSLDVMFKILRP